MESSKRRRTLPVKWETRTAFNCATGFLMLDSSDRISAAARQRGEMLRLPAASVKPHFLIVNRRFSGSTEKPCWGAAGRPGLPGGVVHTRDTGDLGQPPSRESESTKKGSKGNSIPVVVSGRPLHGRKPGARELRGVRKLTRASVRESAYDALQETSPKLMF